MFWRGTLPHSVLGSVLMDFELLQKLYFAVMSCQRMLFLLGIDMVVLEKRWFLDVLAFVVVVVSKCWFSSMVHIVVVFPQETRNSSLTLCTLVQCDPVYRMHSKSQLVFHI